MLGVAVTLAAAVAGFAGVVAEAAVVAAVTGAVAVAVVESAVGIATVAVAAVVELVPEPGALVLVERFESKIKEFVKNKRFENGEGKNRDTIFQVLTAN